MSDGIQGDALRWIGHHSDEDVGWDLPGMRGNISLTAGRGMDAEEFLVRLGADRRQVQQRQLYKDRYDVAPPGVDIDRSAAMSYTCGEWCVVLEDQGYATWFMGYRSVDVMAPRKGEEVVCLTMNAWDPPPLILHAPGDGSAKQAEFGEATGHVAAFDAALQAAGAVFPTVDDASEDEVVEHFEEHYERLSPAVFDAVGRYCGLTVDRSAVEAGLLPLTVIPDPAAPPG